MNASKEIRQKFGLSQEQMAQYLSVSRSLLSLHEIGKRDLPTAAMVKLSELLLFIKQPPLKKKMCTRM
ncbi:MAG: helix-turn-helix domain-containing protein [Ferruginibacter sp.]